MWALKVVFVKGCHLLSKKITANSKKYISINVWKHHQSLTELFCCFDIRLQLIIFIFLIHCTSYFTCLILLFLSQFYSRRNLKILNMNSSQTSIQQANHVNFLLFHGLSSCSRFLLWTNRNKLHANTQERFIKQRANNDNLSALPAKHFH